MKTPDLSRRLTGLMKAAILPCLLMATATSVTAQDYQSYYTVQHPDQFREDWRAFYEESDKRTAAARAHLAHHLDIAYGADEKQRLDIYLPKEGVEDAPIFVFLHGGGFIEGDRAHYGFLAEAFAKHGIITVVPSYRLTSGGFHYPAPAMDTQMAISWIHKNISKYGGDPNHIVVGGHSAGAMLAADIGVNLDWTSERNLPREAIKGIVAVSGRYNISESDKDRDAYAPTDELKAAASPIRHIGSAAPRFLIAVGEPEKIYLKPSQDFHAAVTAKGITSKLVILEEHSHQDTVRALGAEASPLFKAALEVVNGP